MLLYAGHAALCYRFMLLYVALGKLGICCSMLVVLHFGACIVLGMLLVRLVLMLHWGRLLYAGNYAAL